MSESLQVPSPKPANLFKRAADEISAQISEFAKMSRTPALYATVSALIVSMASARKRVKEHYDPKVADARVPWDNLCKERKEINDTLDEAENLANRIANQCKEEDERNRLAQEKLEQAKEQRRILDEAKVIADELKAAGDKAGAREVLAEAKNTTVAITIPSSIPMAPAGMYSRKATWTYEITDAAQINESYLHKVPNEDKIGELVKRLGPGAAKLIGKGIEITKKIPNAIVRGVK